jgi:hypothetical protein
MASFRKRGKVWYFRHTIADGTKRETRGCPDRRATEQMAAAAELEVSKIRGGLIDPKDMAYRDHAAKPLADHLEDWRLDMLAKRKTVKHADQYRDRAGKLLALVKGTPLAELETGRSARALKQTSEKLAAVLNNTYFRDVNPEDIQTALAKLRDHGKSLQTCNHFRAAARAFLLWSSPKTSVIKKRTHVQFM